MGSFEINKSKSSYDIFAAADSMSPGSIMKAMPGDTPATKPIAMVKPFKQKVEKVPNLRHVVAKGGVEAPKDLARHKGKAPNKSGKLIARNVSQSSRKKLAKKKQALPDGSFPIANKGDLANAKEAVGRAKNPAKAKAFINKRAKELGAPKIGK